VFHALLHCRDKGDLPLLQQALTDVNTLPQADRIAYYEILRSCLAPSFLKLTEVAMSLEHTRFYQEFVERLKSEGEQMGRQAQLLRTISRLLGRRLALPGPEALAKMETLPIETLELLAEDLLDFNSPADLDAWLARH
jgi:predicted transposase YdaD